MNPSKNAFTESEIAKLPKWAQEKIKDLSRERNVAVRELNTFLDEQTPSPISITEMLCIGEQCGPSIKKRYIQATDVEFAWHGIELTVSLRDGNYHDNAIQLSWGSEKRGMGHVCMMPLSYNRVQLITKDNMR